MVEKLNLQALGEVKMRREEVVGEPILSSLKRYNSRMHSYFNVKCSLINYWWL